MTKTMPKPRPKRSLLLIISLALNGIFALLLLAYGIGYLVVSNADLNYARYNALVDEMCGEKYQKYLQEYDGSTGEEGKKVFAATVCLRDYKTGKDLDLEPLLTP